MNRAENNAVTGPVSMRKNEIADEFKRALCSFFGYDQNLHYIRATTPSAVATGLKASLGPRDFLNFAVEDSEALEVERNRVNCLGSSKRAIDSQIDRLVQRLGFLTLARKERWNIPKKIEFISEFGLCCTKNSSSS
jgi:hypothetical protein